MVPVLPRASLRTLISYFTATGNYLAGAICHLYINNHPPQPSDTLASFTEATFAGYVAGTAITWDAAHTTPLGNGSIVGALQQFLCTGGATAQTVYGAFLTDSTGANLLMAVQFDQPVIIAQAGDAVIYVPEISLGQPPE